MTLRRIRIIAAILFFCAVTLLFLDFTSATHAWLGWTAKVQFVPALLAANFAVVAGLVLLTLIFGRIYCSVVCPLGVLQDAFSRLAARRRRNRFAYAKALTKVRVLFLLLFVLALAIGFLSAAALIAPYSAYGRIASNIFASVWAAANNVFAFFAEKADSYALYSVDVYFKGAGAFMIALATFLIVAFLAWRGGRTYCNTVCPVGTVLGFLAGYSIFRPFIDASKCVSCGLCEKNCKAKCINAGEHKIDYSRCVACFDCIEKCKKGAITYRPFFVRKAAEEKPRASADAARPAGLRNLKAHSNGRRGFFASAFFLAASAVSKAQEMKLDGGLAPIKPRTPAKRSERIVPPGAGSVANFSDKCTACHLCVSACKTHVLTPSVRAESFLQPEISYERGYCDIDCTECSKVCPSGAILPISKADKVSTQIGRAVWTASLCVVNTDSIQCDNCFRQCPTGAIQMIERDPKGDAKLKIPTVDEARCIGCGACENLCPARPVSAIHVEGCSVHGKI